MRQITRYLGLAFAACIACFSVGVFAEPANPGQYIPRFMLALDEPQGVAMQRLELTLAHWRTGGQTNEESLKSNMRADSNHFVMVSAVPAGVPDWDVPA